MKKEQSILVPDEVILNKIYVIRGLKVMLDEDLADLYQVETRRLNEQVKRNAERFPLDFMFQITREEFENLKSQIATSRWGGRRKRPFAFTEHGVLMLSSVLNSETAIMVNIQIMRIYSRIRQIFLTNKEILIKIEQIEKQVISNSDDITMIFEALRQLLNAPNPPLQRIGYRRKDEPA
jgi:hypothetical protein